MTAQWFVHDILKPHVLSLMQRLPGDIFHQDHARPSTARVSKDFLCTVTALPWPFSSPDLSPIEHIWDYLGRIFIDPPENSFFFSHVMQSLEVLLSRVQCAINDLALSMLFDLV
ncbi:transposable element Tcb2 transposase [Trichonephila clavipes]|uniref:Transposable element Tcb2 transposase n=1 Tax=Trichonephila clavipes TaxID=2585209 RepID=A0A8X6WCM3_TRICX|nr:transposable element Tcb2 transposase [Trichonephila clavipes]